MHTLCAKTSSPGSSTTTWIAWRARSRTSRCCCSSGRIRRRTCWRGGPDRRETRRAAHEAGKAEEFAKHFAIAREDFAAAAKSRPAVRRRRRRHHRRHARDPSAIACPQEHRAAAWAQAYDAIRCCGSSRAPASRRCRCTSRESCLSGMAQSAQRTGRAEESAQFVDRMLTLLANTPFEKTAQQWKTDPASAATTNLTCKNCHAPGACRSWRRSTKALTRHSISLRPEDADRCHAVVEPALRASANRLRQVGHVGGDLQLVTLEPIVAVQDSSPTRSNPHRRDAIAPADLSAGAFSSD